jgi:hypothetical protein
MKSSSASTLRGCTFVAVRVPLVAAQQSNAGESHQRSGMEAIVGMEGFRGNARRCSVADAIVKADIRAVTDAIVRGGASAEAQGGSSPKE